MKRCTLLILGRLAAPAVLLLLTAGVGKAESNSIDKDHSNVAFLPDLEPADRSALNPEKAYSLDELIDLAERSHPRTRQAWEQARQAAASLGMARSEYLPQLSALASLSNERFINPFPKPLATNGYTMVELPAAEAGLAVRYTLLDFGGRRAELGWARESELAARAHLRQANQDVAFAVIEAFYKLMDAQQSLEARRSILATAQTVEEAAEAQLALGRATRPDLLDAQASAAQAEYALVAAQGEERAARVRLREALGVVPSDQIRIAPSAAVADPEQSQEAIAELLERAQLQRPDLAELAAQLRAAQAAARAATAEQRPKAEFTGRGGVQSLWPSVSKDHGEALGDTTQFVWKVGVNIRWSLFDGGRRSDEAQRQASAAQQAAERLREQSNAAQRAVWTAYVEFQTAVRRRQSAAALLAAAEASYASSFEAFRYGVKSLIDLEHAESQLANARLAVVQAASALQIAQANLGYTTGSLLAGPVGAQKP